MDKISIIIPVYNAEAYLVRCLDSVIKQTYENIEILVINDGSTDGSGKICDEYAGKDSRIRVFHIKHGGNSAVPRNVGLDNMTGKYVGFVDSDDWIEPDMYEKLHIAITGVEIAVCSYTEETVTSSYKAENKNKISKRILSAKKMLLYSLAPQYSKGFCVYLWNKLFKSKLFENLRLDESINWASDVLAYTELVARGNIEGKFINEPLYHYNISRSDSISKSESYDIKTDILRAYKCAEELLPGKDRHWARAVYCHHAGTIAEMARKRRDAEMLKKIQEDIKERFGDYKRANRKFSQELKNMESLMNAKLVNKCDYDIDRFAEQVGDKSIVCFGAYKQFSDWIMQNPGITNKIVSIVDNNKAIQGSKCDIDTRKVRIVSLDKFLKMDITDFVVLINTNRNGDNIIKKLDLSGELENVCVYIAEIKKYKNNEVIKKMQAAEIEILEEFVRVCNKHNLKYYLVGGTLLGAARHKGFIPWDDDIDVAMSAVDFEKFVNLPSSEFNDDYFLHWINTDNTCVNIEATFRKRNTYHLYWPRGFETANEKYHAIGMCIFKTLCTKYKRVYGAVSLYDKFWLGIREKFLRLGYQKLGLTMASPKTFFSIFSIPVILKIRELVIKLFAKCESGYWQEKPWTEVFGEGVMLEFEGKFYKAPADWNYFLLKQYGRNYMELPPPEKRFSHCPRKLSFDVKNGIWEDI